ncbi:PREDICTED: ankyrin repeat domain-containing protein 50-like [Amphimedon queenslandica]|uniref:Ankyrin repeat protein n=1 Tax=Amphimedon queenslandica TaxID=400682 RepID=A0AAN0IQS2_AMPQE|nr:PREDICTED: ankyrin repeat domain-containing protein 50-like [Amphimedon queenslandica]|eukprot:XP_011407239.1 PREDICTED: ankyrin repeat domain-containing protein 50-like [Amphimedon queenslandica]
MIEGHPSVPIASNGATVSNTQQEIKFSTKKDEAEVSYSLTELNKTFTSLMTKVRRAFDKKVASDPELLIDLTRWIETYMNWTDKLTNASLNETFNTIHPYYDFIDCCLIVDLSEEFLNGVTFGDGEKLNIVSELQNHKRNADTFRSSSKTALILACERAHEDVVHSLLSAGANANIQDNKGWTAPMLAGERGHENIVHSLLCAGANVNIQDNKGRTALIFAYESNAVMIASYYGNYEVVELLISKGVDYKYQRKDGMNAFMFACQNGHTRIIELLMKKQVDPNEQVDPNIQKKNGWNALMLACKNGHTQIVKLLLKEQVDPNVQQNKWEADPTIKSNKGNTALKFAKTIEISILLNSYIREHNREQQDDTSSEYSHTTGYNTAPSDTCSVRSVPSSLSLDSFSDISSDECDV